MDLHCQDCAKFLQDDQTIDVNRKKTTWVLVLTVIAMVAEIVVGYATRSMAVVADGYHMASHAGALIIALLAYRIARSQKLSRKFSFGAGKVIPLGGYTSAVILALMAVLIFIESLQNIFHPEPIIYNEAIGIAAFGFFINLFCALILNHEHAHSHGHSHGEEDEHECHDEEHAHVHDHNLRAVLFHIAMDAITSLLAVGGLILAKYKGWNWIDPVVGIIGALFILVWAFQLLRDTGWELLDGHSKSVNWKKLKAQIESEGAKIVDFHVWRVAPTAVACELVVEAAQLRGLEHYRRILKEDYLVSHAIIEERAL